MPCSINVQKYLKQACSNEQLFLYLRTECGDKLFLNWAFVAIFYSALHLFYAFLENRGDKIPRSHIGLDGAVEMAQNKFFTNQDGKMDTAGWEYGQLFQWSWDVRYDPENTEMLKKESLNVAAKHLNKVKFVTFSEIGYRASKTNSGKNIFIKEVSADYLENLRLASKSKY